MFAVSLYGTGASTFRKVPGVPCWQKTFRILPARWQQLLFVSKVCPLFINKSMKSQPILIIFVTEHPDETWHRKVILSALSI